MEGNDLSVKEHYHLSTSMSMVRFLILVGKGESENAV
jgi:hypothetical protein